MIKARYQNLLQQDKLKPDTAQAQAVSILQELYEQLLDYDPHRTSGIVNRMKTALFGPQSSPQGVYLWGDVGRGKTLLMNLFYQCLPFEQKARMHFHHFMLDVHEQLSTLHGQKNPLTHLAREYAARYRIICLDEFIVTNITDAMLLYGLLDELFKQGVVLVATSNRIPDDLYLNGLQRERFLPAIALIKQRTTVHHLDSIEDHRMALLEKSDLYHAPITADTKTKMRQQLESLAVSDIIDEAVITVNRREIPTVARSNEVIWFEFEVLCNVPRATPDYIEIAEEYGIVLLSGVPVMTEDMDDKARRFIYLIDELYDKNVTFIMSAEAGVDEIYQGSMLAFAFKRTRSRLIEMRSEHYLSKSHIL